MTESLSTYVRYQLVELEAVIRRAHPLLFLEVVTVTDHFCLLTSVTTQVAQVVLLFQDGPSMHTRARRPAVPL